MARPREFDRDEALERAMGLFWCQGYDATSIESLVEEMEINRGSLYDTFGNKHELFLAAIDKYCGERVSTLLGALDAPGSGTAAIRGFFGVLLDLAASDDGRMGCLLTNSIVELAPHDEEVRARAAAALAGIEDAFCRALERARKAGELDASKDPRALARFLLSSLQGLTVMSKASAGKAALRDIVNVVLSVLD